MQKEGTARLDFIQNIQLKKLLNLLAGLTGEMEKIQINKNPKS